MNTLEITLFGAFAALLLMAAAATYEEADACRSAGDIYRSGVCLER